MATLYWTGSSSGLWATASNWVESDGTSPSSAPGTGDIVVFDARAVNPLTDPPATTIRLSKVQIKHSCPTSSYIGAPLAPITAAVDTFIVGEDDNGSAGTSGVQQICWDFGSTASGYSGTTVRILKTNSTGLNGLEVVQLKGTHADNKMYVEGAGFVGWGTSFPGAAYTLSQCNITGQSARVNLGSGGTLTTIYQSSGNAVANCAFTTLTQQGGTLQTEGTGAVTTATVGGTYTSNSTGTITTLTVTNGGLADFTKTSLARTVTTATVNGTGVLDARNGQALSVTFTNRPGALNGADMSQIRLGTGIYIQHFATA